MNLVIIFTLFVILFPPKHDDIEVIEGEVKIVNGVEYCYTKFGQLCPETKARIEQWQK